MLGTACLWDRDTLAEEMAAGDDRELILGAITGRFDRFPAKYYAMRLERIENDFSEAGGVNALELCDDAGVACDRLGKSEEAIGWMGKKLERMEAGGFSGEVLEAHRYRYHANLGTILAHRWLKADEGERDDADLKEARDHIGAALKINPEAHFGRERAQQVAIEWLIGLGDNGGMELADYFRLSYRADLQSGALGLAGMIRLGAAWESPDIFRALSQTLAYGELGTLSYLAEKRYAELVDAGKVGIRTGDLSAPEFEMTLSQKITEQLEGYWGEARSEAKSWRAERMAYLNEKLGQGEHPDTHPDLWDGYQSTSTPPRYPGRPLFDFVRDLVQNSIPVLVGLWPVFVILMIRRRIAGGRRVAAG